MAIIEHGRTGYQIVTPGRQFPVENEAARRLQRSLLAMTGVRVPVRWGDRKIPVIPTIRVGERDAAHPGLGDPDAYEIVVEGENLWLRGSYRRGTHYAVTAFLESCGARFVLPDEPVLPRVDRIDLPRASVSSTSVFAYRHVFYPDAQIAERALELKLNVHWGDDERWGPNAYPHSWGHSFEALVPTEEYFDEHPEYFSLVDGYRRSERPQLCCTNPDVLEVVSGAVARLIEEHPNRDIFAVGQNDWDNHCECPRCAELDDREGSHMGQVLHLVNEVAKRFPDKYIATLAYMWTVEPPRTMEAADNALIVLCHNYGCYNHGLDACDLNAPFLAQLREWRKRARHILIWDYYVNYRHYLLPTANFRRIANDIRLYRDEGVSAMFCQGSAASGGQFEHLRQYVQAKLLWNPDRHLDELMTEWAEGVFGPAAARPVLDYLNAMEDVQVDRDIHMYRFSQPRMPDLFTPEFLEHGCELWDEAERVAENDQCRRRVRAHRSAEMAARLIHTPGHYEVNGGELRLEPPVDRELVDRFVDACLDNNVSYLREDRGAPEDFRRDFGRTYRTVTIVSDSMRAVIAPQLGGRLYSLVMHDVGGDEPIRAQGDTAGGAGRELLAVPALYENVTSMPYGDGYDFSVVPGRGGAIEVYEVVEETDASVQLRASIASERGEGIILASRFAVDGTELSFEHEVRSNADVDRVLEPCATITLNRELFADESTVDVLDSSGSWKSVGLNPERRRRREVPFAGAELPAGAVRVVSPGQTPAVELSFDADGVEAVVIRVGEGGVAVELRFAPRLLAAGAVARFAWSLATEVDRR